MLNSRMKLSVSLLMLVVNMVSVQSASLENGPRKRSFSMDWRGNSLNVLEANKVFKPARTTIIRPYYIPVSGTLGHYIYYPPPPFYHNAGAPFDNPIKPPFQGPSYLPPTRPTEKPNGVDNRFGYEDEEMGPSWGTTNMGSMQLSGGQDSQGSVTPTRPPISSIPAPPPLIHTVQENQSPSLGDESAQRPGSFAQSSTQPKEGPQTPSTPSGPSNCVWAIISCCSVSNPNEFSEACFEQRGCPGPFWGTKPCDSKYAKGAIAAASQYFSGNRFSEEVKRLS